MHIFLLKSYKNTFFFYIKKKRLHIFKNIVNKLKAKVFQFIQLIHETKEKCLLLYYRFTRDASEHNTLIHTGGQ